MPADPVRKRQSGRRSAGAPDETRNSSGLRQPGGSGGGRADETVDRAISRIAAGRRGNVTRRQLLALGLSDDDIDYRLRIGRLHRQFRGVYLVGHDVAPHLSRELAALLTAGPHSVLSRQTSAWMHGCCERPEDVHVTITRGQRREQPGLVVRHSSTLDPRAVWRRDGLRLTGPAQTILDLAATVPVQELEPILNEALVKRRTSRRALLEAVERGPGRAGTKVLKALLDTAPLETLSEAERVLLRLVRQSGLPEPEVNRWRAIGRVDLRWPGYVVEVDGYHAHTTPRAFERDRRRDRAARAAGHAVDRFAASEVLREPLRVLAEIVRVLATLPAQQAE